MTEKHSPSSKSLTLDDLRQFTGTEHWYRHPFVRKVLYTDGVQYVAEHGGAYWLIDEIAFAQANVAVARERFQHWKLSVDLKAQTGVLTCDDGNYNVVYKKQLAYTDFPLCQIGLYFTDNVILLTGEY